MLKQIIKKLKFMALSNSWHGNDLLEASENNMHLRRSIRYADKKKKVVDLDTPELLRYNPRNILKYK